MKSKPLVVLLTMGLVACIDDPPTDLPPLLPVSFSAYEAYAGAPVTIRSAQFTQLRGIEIWVDTLQLPGLAAAGDSVVVTLPRRARGTVTLRLGRNGPALGDVELAGFVARRTITPLLGFELLVWPEGAARASVIGTNAGIDGTWREGNVLQLTPATGTTTTLVSGFRLSVSGGPRLPGRTPDPNVFLLPPMNLTGLHVWRLLPQPEALDTLAESNFRHAALLSDTIFLSAATRIVETRRLGTDQIIYRGSYEDTDEIIISPTGDRATLRVNGTEGGVPVFNTARGDTAYHVRQMFASHGASFSQNGDTLWMLGATREQASEGVGRAVLVMLNARTGAVLNETTFPHAAHTMRRDSNGGRLFILRTARPDWPVDLVVVDERTLKVIGHVEAPRLEACEAYCEYSVVAVGADGVFVVTPRDVFEFDYLK